MGGEGGLDVLSVIIVFTFIKLITPHLPLLPPADQAGNEIEISAQILVNKAGFRVKPSSIIYNELKVGFPYRRLILVYLLTYRRERR